MLEQDPYADFLCYPFVNRHIADSEIGCDNNSHDGPCRVRLNELVDGPICRVGLIWAGDEWTFVAGNQDTRINRYRNGRESLYWLPLQDECVLEMLTTLCEENHNVTLFGRLCGPGIGLTYGLTEPEWRLFDIAVDCDYWGWDAIADICEDHGVLVAPLLYAGDYRHGLLEAYCAGTSRMGTGVSERRGVFQSPSCYGPQWQVRPRYELLSPDYKELRQWPPLNRND